MIIIIIVKITIIKEKINDLLFMDDLKLYSRSEKG